MARARRPVEMVPIKPLLYSFESTAAALDVDVATVEAYIAEGRLRGILLNTHEPRVIVEDVEALKRGEVRHYRPKPPPEPPPPQMIDFPILPSALARYTKGTVKMSDLATLLGVPADVLERTLFSQLITTNRTISVRKFLLVLAIGTHRNGVRQETRRPQISETQPHRIYRRDNGCCRYCGKRPRRYQRSLDHVVPWSQGGGHVDDNLVLACLPCNYKKRERTPEEAGMILRDLEPPPEHSGSEVF